MYGETASSERLDFKSKIAQGRHQALEHHGFFWQKVHDGGPGKKLSGLCLLFAQAVEDDPFMSRVLVYQNKAVRGFKQDERVCKLPKKIEVRIGKCPRIHLSLYRRIRRPFSQDSLAGRPSAYTANRGYTGSWMSKGFSRSNKSSWTPDQS